MHCYQIRYTRLNKENEPYRDKKGKIAFIVETFFDYIREGALKQFKTAHRDELANLTKIRVSRVR